MRSYSSVLRALWDCGKCAKGPGTWYVIAFFLIALAGGALVQAALTLGKAAACDVMMGAKRSKPKVEQGCLG
jgi:hypothetical protein